MHAEFPDVVPVGEEAGELRAYPYHIYLAQFMCYWLAHRVQWPDNLRPNIIELVTQSPVGKRGLIELQMKDICLYQQQGHPCSHTRRAR